MTLNIADHILKEAQKMALASDSTLSAVVETAIRVMLHRRKQPDALKKVRLVTYKGFGPRRGVDLDDSAALLDLMEKPCYSSWM